MPRRNAHNQTSFSPKGHSAHLVVSAPGPVLDPKYPSLMDAAPSRQELEAAHCWEPEDRVPGRPEMTTFRQQLRLHQAGWREAHGHPIGTQPIVPARGKPKRKVGSRLPLDYAQETGANFITRGALEGARHRTSFVEPKQSVDHQRLWADLLWSPAMAFNLFGDLSGNIKVADRAVHTWWPGTPGTVTEIRFAHSPGWFDPAYINSLRSFDTAFVLDLKDGTKGILAVNVKYHERLKAEEPRPENLRRYVHVGRMSGEFRRGALDSLKGRGELAVMWIEHLLLHSMLQHPSGEWTWGRYVVVHPDRNTDFAKACARYRGLLNDDTKFSSMTLETLLDAGALPKRTVKALRERYFPR
jgi:PD-(D/E)XK nuclease superfamily